METAMKKVFLVYEDDYGGTFSPWYLTRVCSSREEAERYIDGRGKWLCRIKEHHNLGPALENYPETIGGLFSDD